MKRKYTIPLAFILFIIEYIAIPLAILKFTNIESINKAAFFIILSSIFFAFSSNLIFTYFLGKQIIFPISSAIISLGLLFIFNKSVLIIIGLIVIFSFLGYYLGSIFHKKD